MRTCGVLIPAYNEAASIGAVVRPALESGLGTVLVVDDGSSDDTAGAAAAAGAEVLRLDTNVGKGGAVAAGAEHLTTDVVVLVDADLTGLQPAHLIALADPIRFGEADMSRGVFAGGRWHTMAAQRLTPQLNGQRGLLRDQLLEIDGLAGSRYGIEIAITEHARAYGWRCVDVPMHGVSQVVKEEKRGFARGFMLRLGMYVDIAGTWFRKHGR